ncbi:RNA-binding protein 26-like [Mercenaria mercenaria]|uniref:RNA-binding protein 26-like n=1 Tax=Mercenaria mercenaria TaxID=6596 RepID=UPI00234EF8DA|nr:RNA-binding protein 26-like [Mercenaria mercenaria]
MLVDDLEQLKDWLTASLSPICEADPSALAKYIVALVKKDKPLSDLKDSCTDQLDVFLQTKTKDFVDTLFEVIENKSYMVKKEEAPPAPDQLPDSVPEVPPTENDATPTSSDQQLVTSTSKIDIKKEEELQKAFPIAEKRPLKSRSRSISPRTRSREEDRRRRLDDRRNFDRGYQRRRSTSPRLRRYRSRSPYRRRSPFRPVRRSRSPGPRGRGRGRSRSRSWSRSWSRSPRSRSRERMRSRSPGGRIRSRSPGGRIRSRSPGGRIRSRSPGGRIRSRSPGGRIRSRSPGGRIRSRSPNGRIRSRSPGGRIRSRSPGGRVRSRSPGGRSPRREVRARSPRGRSPYRRSVSPRFRSRSPRKRSRSLAGSKSPRSRSSFSPNRSRSRSPLRKVRRNSQDSRGPTPTQENGLADSTNPTPTDSHSSISVVTHTSGRYGEVQSASRIRCRDYDEKGFCVRGDLCVYDHGNDPVVVESVSQYPSGPPPSLPGHPHPPGPPPPMHMGIPPPGFFNRMPGPPIHVRPDFHQEPYNPEAPGLTRSGPPPYWPGGPDNMPPFMKGPPPSHPPPSHVPVKSRLGNRDLVSLTVRREVKDEPEDEDTPTSSTRTVIAPKDEPPLSVAQPPPPGVPVPDTIPSQPPPGPQGHYSHHQQRFHPYQRFPGPRKPFDYNRIGGYRRPDQTNCTLEVRKIPPEFNNIAKINEHFGKFGSLTNIQVKFEGDPEAALVSFSSNQEALSCYKCSEPVFNNRFIKLFWHQKNKDNGNQDASSVSTTTQGVTQEDSNVSVKSRLGPIPPASKMQLNNLIKKSTEGTATTDASATNTHPEQTVTYISTGISKTVHNPAALAMAAAARAKAQAQAQAALSSPTAVKAADFVSKMEKVKQIDAMKKEAAAKKLEIQKHKQELLERQIEQQKKLIATLEKNKDMKEPNKKAIMETLKTLSNSIDKLKTELSTSSAGFKSDSGLPGTSLTVKSPEQAKKEILDMELELMTKTSSGEETIELKKKLSELTKVANSMGLLGRGRGRGAVARGRAATTWVASGIGPPAGPPGFGRGRGRGALFGKAAVATRTLDRRPKVVEVVGFDAEEKEEITSHINGLKEVEKIEFNMDIPSAIVTFKTRRDAEMGILHGSKFKTKTLKMNWHIPKPDFSRSSSTTSVETEDHEEIDEEALLAGVEDEEEENEEERSWRP